MSDILDDLRKGALRSVDGSAIYCELPESVIQRAIDEIATLRDKIDQLRLIAGAANVERPFSDIKKEARHV